jgi:uncharacterized pyridoxamine 5'-phosphate oxidase family protein
MQATSFEALQAEFMTRVQQAVYCNVATVDLKGRPRSRVMHLVWEGSTGWVVTWPESPKARHLANNPHVSIAYLSNPMKPVYVESTAEWVTTTEEQLRVWELYKTIPLGFDLTPHYGTIEHKFFGLLRFRPWRIELAELWKESLIWRPRQK